MSKCDIWSADIEFSFIIYPFWNSFALTAQFLNQSCDNYIDIIIWNVLLLFLALFIITETIVLIWYVSLKQSVNQTYRKLRISVKPIENTANNHWNPSTCLRYFVWIVNLKCIFQVVYHSQ